MSSLTEEYERAELQRRKAQMDAERDARTWPTRAFELAEQQAKQKVRGVQVFGPGPKPEPDWASMPSRGEDE
jgi:hypothetical protein